MVRWRLDRLGSAAGIAGGPIAGIFSDSGLQNGSGNSARLPQFLAWSGGLFFLGQGERVIDHNFGTHRA